MVIQPDGAETIEFEFQCFSKIDPALVRSCVLSLPLMMQAAVHEQVVTPWDVQGSVTEDGKQSAIDYDKLIVQFGTKRIDDALLERFEKVTGHRAHPLMRRGMFFSHR